MFCKSYKNTKFYYGLIGIGILSFVFGILFNMRIPEEAHNLSMLSGMLTGIGGAFIAVSVIRLLKVKYSTPEKLKAEEIEMKDERNILILRKSYSIVAISSIILFIAIIFLFLLLDYMIPAIVAIAFMYAQILIFIISYRIIRSKM